MVHSFVFRPVYCLLVVSLVFLDILKLSETSLIKNPLCSIILSRSCSFVHFFQSKWLLTFSSNTISQMSLYNIIHIRFTHFPYSTLYWVMKGKKMKNEIRQLIRLFTSVHQIKQWLSYNANKQKTLCPETLKTKMTSLASQSPHNGQFCTESYNNVQNKKIMSAMQAKHHHH